MRFALAFVPHLRAPPLFQQLVYDAPFPAIAPDEYVDLTQFGLGVMQAFGVMTGFGKDPSGVPLYVATVVVAPHEPSRDVANRR